MKDGRLAVRFATEYDTSVEIVAALLACCCEARELEDYWQNPSPEVLADVWYQVTEGGLIDSREFVWGEHGGAWALQLGMEDFSDSPLTF